MDPNLLNDDLQTRMFVEAGQASISAKEHLNTTVGMLDEIVQRIDEFNPSFVVTCARGSSDHAATYGKYLIEKNIGLPVVSHAPSMSSIYARPLRMEKALFIAISQSGGSPDLVKSAQLARERGALTIALVNVTSSPLADVCEFVLPLCAGEEKSVAATKSYILSLVAIANLVGAWMPSDELNKALSQLPEKLSEAWSYDWSAALPILQEAQNFFVVGRGFSLGIAQEAALKFKETAGLHAEAYSAAEVRHGPMAIIKKYFPIFMFVPNDRSSESFDLAASEFIDRGAKVITVGKSYKGAVSLPTVDVELPELNVICMIQSFYKLMNQLSLDRGYNPDVPPFLKKVTETV